MKWFGTLVLAGSLCFSAGCLSHVAFQGGQLHKCRGPFFSTIYLAEFQELDLNEDGQYAIQFRGFPASPVDLDIDLPDRTNGDRASLERIGSEVTMELATAAGLPVCQAHGKLNQHQGVVDHFWGLAGGPDEASFWNSDCLWLKIRRDESYILKIAVSGATPALGPLRARPRISTPHD